MAAEPALLTDEHAHHSKSAGFLDGFFATTPAALEASDGDPIINSKEGNAESGAPYSSSFHFLSEKPQDGGVFQASIEDPNAQSSADLSCFAHAHAHAQLRADGAGFPYPDVLSKGAHTHLRTVYEGFTYPHQTLYNPSSVACAPSCEESVHIVCEEQVSSAEPNGHHEDCACPHVISNDPQHPHCAGSAHAGTKFQDPHVQPSRMSVHSIEESTSLKEEGGDYTEPCGSDEDSTFSHAAYEGLCNDSEGFRDPFEESMDPEFQPLDAHGASTSECSSATSMVTNATLDDSSMSVDGIESHWTDAKHGSYLNYMETNFVNDLFGREYCALDVCGQGPSRQGSKSSSPLPSNLFEFKSWQSGDWHRRSMLKPPLPTCIPLPLFKSPLVDHFCHHKFPRAKHQIKMEIKMEKVSTAWGVDGEEEVNSPVTELHRGTPRHLHTSRSKAGYEQKFSCKNHRSGDEALKVLQQDGLQEFAHDTEISSFSNTKKRGLETDIEHEPFVRCRRDISL